MAYFKKGRVLAQDGDGNLPFLVRVPTSADCVRERRPGLTVNLRSTLEPVTARWLGCRSATHFEDGLALDRLVCRQRCHADGGAAESDILESQLATSLEGRDESANKRRHHAGMVPADRRLIKFRARG